MRTQPPVTLALPQPISSFPLEREPSSPANAKSWHSKMILTQLQDLVTWITIVVMQPADQPGNGFFTGFWLGLALPELESSWLKSISISWRPHKITWGIKLPVSLFLLSSETTCRDMKHHLKSSHCILTAILINTRPLALCLLVENSIGLSFTSRYWLKFK